MFQDTVMPTIGNELDRLKEKRWRSKNLSIRNYKKSLQLLRLHSDCFTVCSLNKKRRIIIFQDTYFYSMQSKSFALLLYLI